MINSTMPISETNRTIPVSREKPSSERRNDQGGGNPVQIQQMNQPEMRSVSKKELLEAVEETNRIIFGDSGRFEFKIHEKTGRYLVKLVDIETEEVLREIPPEKILDLIANIWEMVGILVDERG